MKTAEEWGRLAVSLPGWRWMPGMFDAASGWRWDGHSFVEQGARHPQAGNCIEGVPEHWPDPDDSATEGCLIRLLGPSVHVVVGYLKEVILTGVPMVEGRHPSGMGTTLGRACIAAAAALGRWPGGEG